MLLVTGGAGFIGANFILEWLATSEEAIINLDTLTYAGHLENLASLQENKRHAFVRGDINDGDLVQSLLQKYHPRACIHFAAESHVDRSIDNPNIFIETNVKGTLTLLHESLKYWHSLDDTNQKSFRFLHISTDEVYGSLDSNASPFTELNKYEPNSPYSASKAASDHLVRAWHHTYGLPVLTTHCSNNYGPYQFPEKFIPLIIMNALAHKPLPIYGDGLNIRDWLYVSDHCSAIRTVLSKGKIGGTYNIGGWNEISNIDIARTVCQLLDEMKPNPEGTYEKLITFVKDRPGHDRRYAIDARKIEKELGWRPSETFTSGICKTVKWYLEHAAWIASVKNKASFFI